MFERIERGIYWDKFWPLVDGCTPVDSTCDHCWRAREANFRSYGAKDLLSGPSWNCQIRPRPDKFNLPIKVKKPTVWFVLNDLYHEMVAANFITHAYEVMETCPQHIFIVCTKRPERIIPVLYGEEGHFYMGGGDYLPNVWHMTTAGNQEMADKRIPELLKLRQASLGWPVLGVSIEPMLSAIDLSGFLGGTNNESRKSILRSNEIGSFLNRRPGKNLETQEIREFQPSRQSKKTNHNTNQKGRNGKISQPSSSSDVPGVKENCGLCSPGSVDSLQSTRYSDREGNQPRRRESRQQSPEESSFSYKTRKYTSCGKGFEGNGEKEAERRNEFISKIKRRSGTPDQRFGRGETVATENNRILVPDFPIPSECNSSRAKLASCGLDWIICGGESGPGARPTMHPEWVRSVRDQCQAAGVPFLFKQWGEWLPVGTPRLKIKISDRKIIHLDGTSTSATWDDVINSAGDLWAIERVGKKAAGRLLDGEEYSELPTKE